MNARRLLRVSTKRAMRTLGLPEASGPAKAKLASRGGGGGGKKVGGFLGPGALRGGKPRRAELHVAVGAGAGVAAHEHERAIEARREQRQVGAHQPLPLDE